MRDIAKALSVFFQIGITMLVPILMCVIIGSFIDGFFHTDGIFVIIFAVLGVGASFRSLYMLTKSFYDEKDSDKK